jgi:hypothetical protein
LATVSAFFARKRPRLTGLIRCAADCRATGIPPQKQPIGQHLRIFPRPRSARREDNNKDTPKNVERPDELAAEMKAEVDKTDSTKVLLLNLMKEAEEIEELSHEIRKCSKGQSGRELRLLPDVPQPLLVAGGRRTRD